jgi:hypothetical protein
MALQLKSLQVLHPINKLYICFFSMDHIQISRGKRTPYTKGNANVDGDDVYNDR